MPTGLHHLSRRAADLPPPAALLPSLLPQKGVAVLDSAAFHPAWGRYSRVGLSPRCTLSIDNRGRVRTEGDELRHLPAHTTDPLRVWSAALGALRHRPAETYGCGWIGFFSYDLCRTLEQLPATATDELNWPMLRWTFYDAAAVYDHISREWTVHAAGADQAKTQRKLTHTLRSLRTVRAGHDERAGPSSAPADWHSNFTVDSYLTAVRRAKEYIAAGDIFQVNLAQRFSAATTLSPAALYLQLRQANPSWFAAFLRWDQCAALSLSPELFLRVRGDQVTTRPIKGTRPRGKDPRQDCQLRNELAASEKDRAELTMIVDLLRNDLGRVCRFGSVRVTDPRCIEAYPSVHHGVATIQGRLREGTTLADLIGATFPGGSITGAPKVRAMQIIEALEPVRRGLYTGSIGAIDPNGNADFNIAIRTVACQVGRIYCHLGGGIVADSDPLAEYEETLHKGKALLTTIASAKTAPFAPGSAGGLGLVHVVPPAKPGANGNRAHERTSLSQP